MIMLMKMVNETVLLILFTQLLGSMGQDLKNHAIDIGIGGVGAFGKGAVDIGTNALKAKFKRT